MHRFRDEFSRLLEASNSNLTENDVRIATKECRDEVYSEAMEAGDSIATPFFNFVSRDDTAVFTFFESKFAMFVVSGEERALIDETNDLSLVDTARCRELLKVKYKKEKPDIEIPRSVAEHWLS